MKKKKKIHTRIRRDVRGRFDRRCRRSRRSGPPCSGRSGSIPWIRPRLLTRILIRRLLLLWLLLQWRLWLLLRRIIVVEVWPANINTAAMTTSSSVSSSSSSTSPSSSSAIAARITSSTTSTITPSPSPSPSSPSPKSTAAASFHWKIGSKRTNQRENSTQLPTRFLLQKPTKTNK